MGQVQSLTRGLTLLETLAGSPVALNLTDISEKVGLPPSTVHRLLNTLLQQQFVAQDGERAEWSVGVKAFSVGNAYLKSRDFITAARPFMRELVAETGETSNLAILENGMPVFVAQIECDEMMRMVAKLGSHAPVHASGVGKAMLSVKPDNEIQALLGKPPYRQFTEKTYTTSEALLAELQRVRQQGFAVDNEEQSPGLRCVAANIYNEYGEAVAAISISGPVQRVTEVRVQVLGGIVRTKADAITHALGGTAPAS